jgi:CubicO group peptidase (beta-lactamase class C family)
MRVLFGKVTATTLLLFCFHLAVRADAVDDFVTTQMQKRHIPGLSLAVIKDGKVVKMCGYGLASVELGAPATKDSVYQIASLTKAFTATAIMMLTEDGKLGLDDQITKHLGGLPATWGGITIRHLLTHTSGLVADPVPWSMETVARPYTSDELLKLITGAPLQFPPGTMYRYANSDYYLLALIIEKVSGKSYGEFLSERIFKPLGMTATRVDDPWEVVPGKVTGYGWDHDKLNVPPSIHPSQLLGSGNLLSTVTDLAKFDAGLTGGRLLRKTSLEQMWTPAKINGEEIGYGLGWTIYDYRGHKVVGHGGNVPGFASQLSHYVGDGTTIILLCNMFGGDDSPYKLSLRLATKIIADLAIPARPIVDTDPQVTQNVRLLVQGISEGKVDPALLSPRMRAAWSPDIIKILKQLYEQEKGRLKTLELLERKTDGANRLYMYRAAFEKETVLYYVRVTGEGTIDSFDQDPADE